MADETADALKKAEEAAKKAEEVAKKGKDVVAEMANELYSRFAPGLKSVYGGITNLASGTGEMAKQFANANGANLELIKSFEKLSLVSSQAIAIMAKKDLFAGFTQGATKSFATIDDQYKDLINTFGGDQSKAFAWLKDSKLIPKEVFDKGTAAVSAFIEKAGNVQRLQQAFVGMQSASGGLNEVFANMSDIQGTLSKKTLEFEQRIISAAEATNLLPAEVSKAAASIGRLPGGLKETVSSSDKAGGSLDILTAALRTAAGTGRENSEVLDILNKSYEDLSNAQGEVTDSGTKGLKMFSLMSQASGDLNVRFSDTKKILESAADQFKFMGDNTEGATKVLYTYIDALRNTGLTTKASTEIIESMIKSVANLSIGTKALLSARSGGPGGLQGAFQVEKLIREGKTDEVIKMMESSLRKQFGGRIYSLQEAATSQEAAGQFMRQREFLKSGPFGQLVGNDENKATRLLEAMSSGGKFAKAPGSAQEVLDDTLKKGNAIQQTGNTELARLNGGINRQIIIGETQISLLAKMSGAADRELESFRKKAEDKMGEQVSEVTDESLGGMALDSNRQIIEGAKRTAANTLSTAEQGIESISSNLTSSIKSIGGEIGKKAEEEKYKKRQAATSRGIARGMPTEKDMVAQGLVLPGMGGTVAPAVRVSQAAQKVQVESKPTDINLRLKITAPEGFGVEAESDGSENSLKIFNMAGKGIGVSVPTD